MIDKNKSEFISDILDKQYKNYSWHDGKVQALIASNSLIITGVLLIIRSDNFPLNSQNFFLFFGLIIAVISLIIALTHAIPILSSGKGGSEKPNPRSVNGITSYVNASDYSKEILNLSDEEIFQFTAIQAYGMAFNNRRSHKKIKYSSLLTMLSVILTIFYILLNYTC